MPTGAIILLAVVGAIWIGIAVYLIIYFTQVKRRFFFVYGSHEILLHVKYYSVALLVDGVTVDELSGHRMRIVTLGAMVDGVEVKVRAEARFLTFVVTATAGGVPIPLIRVDK